MAFRSAPSVTSGGDTAPATKGNGVFRSAPSATQSRPVQSQPGATPDLAKIATAKAKYATDSGWGNGNTLQKLYTYAKALVLNPTVAGHDIATHQPIRTVTGGGVITQRQANINQTGKPGIEVDHIIPLDIGGTNDKSNLQIQQGNANQVGTATGNKDVEEQLLGTQLRQGKISAAQAQQQMKDWIAKNGGSKPLAKPAPNPVVNALDTVSNTGNKLLTKTNDPVHSAIDYIAKLNVLNKLDRTGTLSSYLHNQIEPQVKEGLYLSGGGAGEKGIKNVLSRGEGLLSIAGGAFSASPGGVAYNAALGTAAGLEKNIKTGASLKQGVKNIQSGVTKPVDIAGDILQVKNPKTQNALNTAIMLGTIGVSHYMGVRAGAADVNSIVKSTDPTTITKPLDNIMQKAGVSLNDAEAAQASSALADIKSKSQAKAYIQSLVKDKITQSTPDINGSTEAAATTPKTEPTISEPVKTENQPTVSGPTNQAKTFQDLPKVEPATKSFAVSSNEEQFTNQRKAAVNNYAIIGKTSHMGAQPENAGLRVLEQQVETPQGQAAAKAELDGQIKSGNIKPNPDGTITVYRGGEPNANVNLVSVSTDKALAAEHGPVKSFQVSPEDVAVASRGLDKGELLVKKSALAGDDRLPIPDKNQPQNGTFTADEKGNATINTAPKPVEQQLADAQLANQQAKAKQIETETEIQASQAKPAETVRQALQSHADSQEIKHQAAQEQRDLANDRLGGELNNLRRVISNAERQKSGLDVTKIPGLDEATQALRDATGNQDLTTNDLVDYVESIPTQSEVDALKPPKLGTATNPKEKTIADKEIKPVASKGEKLTPRLSKRIAEETGKDFGDKYSKAILEDNANKAEEMVKNNLQRAIDIATGKETLPNDVLGGSVYHAVREYAQANGDIELLMDMRNFRRQSTRLGQEIKSLDNGDTHDPVKLFTNIEDARIEAKGGEKKVNQSIQKDIKKTRAAIENKIYDKSSWKSVINSFRC